MPKTQLGNIVFTFCIALIAGQQSMGQGRKLAVVVGVDTYRASSGLPSLQHAGSDAERLSDALRQCGYTVYEMTQEIARQAGNESSAPYAANVRDQIDGVLSFPNLGPGDSILITFHGHGVQFEHTDPGGTKSPRFYFCPADASVQGVTADSQLTDRNYLIPLQEIYELLKDCKAGTKLLVVDACRNDPSRPSVFRSGLASATLPKLPPPPGGTAAFFSCKANERAVEDPEFQQGVFTHFLVEGLLGKADQPLANKPADGIVTFSELTTYVANNTYAFVYDKYKVKQSPEMRGEFDLNLPLASISPAEFTNSIGMKLVLIKAGTFMMGSSDSDQDAYNFEKPQHRVTLSQDYYLGTTEATQGQWESVMGTTPWRGKEYVKEGSNYAATYVSWEDAIEFCKKLSSLEGKSYRLPTEAEWEYACRGDTTTAYSFGADASSLSNYGWWGGFYGDGNAKSEQYAHQVGQKRANPLGLYDMHGNVSEWCSDWYGEYSSGSVTDPRGPSSGSDRVIRGGSWSYYARDCRSALRNSNAPDFRFDGLGFRVAVGR
ncbi:MAG: SUMF1/EgtB/PvdO family nonheme iron enzyme [Planctomycetales bacterium]|nr:SUMF1/EgtB/PvdO family nonheme iron enzyme [Planctomycetales bacterium]